MSRKISCAGSLPALPVPNIWKKLHFRYPDKVDEAQHSRCCNDQPYKEALKFAATLIAHYPDRLGPCMTFLYAKLGTLSGVKRLKKSLLTA